VLLVCELPHCIGCNLLPAHRIKIIGLATNLKSFLLMKKATCQKIKYIAVRRPVTPIAFLGPGFRPPRFMFVVDLFGAKFSAAMTQVCRRLVIAFLGPGIRPPRLRFVVDSPFWGQVFGRQDSGLSSACNRLFGARFSAAMAQVCHRLAFLGPSFRPPRLRFVVGL